ncbi:MAG TPA: hypothetical protein PKL46_06120 [Aquabacterium sp.]|nr:hypothetical protein [Aquabacterium sp.]
MPLLPASVCTRPGWTVQSACHVKTLVRCVPNRSMTACASACGETRNTQTKLVTAACR